MSSTVHLSETTTRSVPLADVPALVKSCRFVYLWVTFTNRDGGVWVKTGKQTTIKAFRERAVYTKGGGHLNRPAAEVRVMTNEVNNLFIG